MNFLMRGICPPHFFLLYLYKLISIKMAKYKLKVYGWEMEAVAHSITDEQVEAIQELVDENEYDELTEARWELEDEGILDDFYNPDLFHMSAPMDNGNTWFELEDEEGNVVLKFDDKEVGDIYDLVGDDDVIEEKYPYPSYVAIPEDMDGVDNILISFDENKGGIYEMELESDEVPTAKDFCYQSGSVDTPEGDWDYIARIFFKDQLLEVADHLDNRGKASTMQIFRKDGSMIE